jgi:hypothetical protein
VRTQVVFFLAALTAPALGAEAESAAVPTARYHMVDLAGRPPVHLGGVAAGMEWGLSDFWNLQLAVSGDAGATVPGVAAAGGTVGLQVATLIDATQWIPTLAAGLRGGLLDLGLDRTIDGYLELYGGGGVDFRPRRGWSVGVFGFGGVTWSLPGFGVSAGALLLAKVYLGP